MVVRELITLLGFKVDDSKLKSYENGVKAATKTIAVAGTTVLGLGGYFIKLAGDMEQTQTAFEVLLGSADEARKMISDINTMGAKTPYESADLIENAKLLLNFGTEAKDILPTLSMLGDVGMGSADKLHSLTLAFAQISSTGRLQGQDLLQLINAGFNPLQVISKQTGKSMAQLKKEMESGAISADMVKNAFKTVTSEGGTFFEMMKKQSGTFLGMWSTAVDSVKMLAVEIGQELLPFGKDLLFEFAAFMDANKDLIKAGFVKVFRGIAIAIGYVIVAVEEVGEAFGGWTNILKTVWKILSTVFSIVGKIVKVLWNFRRAIVVLTAALLAYNLAMKIITAGGFISWLLKLMQVQKGAAAVQWLLNAAMSANPIALMVAGVAAFATTVYLLYKNWDSVVDIIKKAVTWVKEFFGFQVDKSTLQSNLETPVSAKSQESVVKRRPVLRSAKSNSPTENANQNAQQKTKPIPKFARGSAFVPNDGLAYLHRGEKVLTANQVARSENSRVNNSVQITAPVSVTVPPGTPENQVRFIEQAAKRIFNEGFQSILRQAKASHPVLGVA